jgi:hypothetical protein
MPHGNWNRQTGMAQVQQAMLASGQWNKAGKGCYRHESGIEVCKANNGWVVSTQPKLAWSRLWVAAEQAERDAAAGKRPGK